MFSARSAPLLLAVCALAAPLHAGVVNLGKYHAKITPEQVATLSFQGRGLVSDVVPDVSQRIEKGAIVGILDKEKMAEAEEDMELQLMRERLTKRDEVRKLKLQRERLSFYMKLSPAERKYATDMRPQEGEESSLEDIDERIALLEKELSLVERRRRAEFNKQHENNTLRMPFTGRLQYHVPIPEDTTRPFEYTQGGMRPFASVCDDSAFYITISISDTEVGLLPAEQLSAQINFPSGDTLRGVFSFRRVEKNNSGHDMLVYFFKLPQEDHATAYNMLGSNAEASLLYSTDENMQAIPKMQLLTHPAAPKCEDWKQLVNEALPGYTVVIVTEREVLVRKQ